MEPLSNNLPTQLWHHFGFACLARSTDSPIQSQSPSLTLFPCASFLGQTLSSSSAAAGAEGGFPPSQGTALRPTFASHGLGLQTLFFFLGCKQALQPPGGPAPHPRRSQSRSVLPRISEHWHGTKYELFLTPTSVQCRSYKGAEDLMPLSLQARGEDSKATTSYRNLKLLGTGNP